jgi:hypothetical protein
LKLLNNVSDYELDEQAFTDVLEAFRDAAGTDLFLNRRALQEVGISPDALVSIRLKDVKHRTALRLILDSVDKSLYFSVLDGVVVVTASSRDTYEGELFSGGSGPAEGASQPEPTDVRPAADELASENQGKEDSANLPSRALSDVPRVPTSGAEDIELLKVTLRAAEDRLNLIKAAYEESSVATVELQEAKTAVEIAERRLVKATREYAAQEQLLALDLQGAQLVLDGAKAELDEALQINQESPGTISPFHVRQKQLNLEKAELDVERAKTVLDLHRKPVEGDSP